MKKINLILLFFMVFILSSCSTYERLNQNIFTMGTVVNVKIDHKNKNEAENHFKEIKAIFDYYHELATNEEASIHQYHNVYYINSSIKKTTEEQITIQVEKELYEMIELALKIEKETTVNGIKYFDISMGQIIDEWKEWLKLEFENMSEEEKHQSLIDVKERVAAIPLIHEGITLTKVGETHYLTVKQGVKIDLGAIAKGFALEEVKKYLKTNKVDSYLVNAGGSSIISGINRKKENGQYLIGLEDPVKSLNYKTGFYAKVNISNMGLTTSGNHKQFVKVKEDEKINIYHHIISPQTKKPEMFYHTVTLFEENVALADGLTTALFNMPKEVLTTYLKEKDHHLILYQTDETIQLMFKEELYDLQWEQGYR